MTAVNKIASTPWTIIIIALRGTGMSWRRIAALLGSPSTTVFDEAKRCGISGTAVVEGRVLSQRELTLIEEHAFGEPDELAALEKSNLARLDDQRAAFEEEARKRRAERTAEDIAVVDDDAKPLETSRFRNLMFAEPWTETAATDVVEWVEENVAVSPRERVVALPYDVKLKSAKARSLAGHDRDWDRIRTELTSMPVPVVDWEDLGRDEQRILQGFANTRMVWTTVLDENAVEVLILPDLVKRPEHEPSHLIGLTEATKALAAPRMKPLANPALASLGVAGEAALDRRIERALRNRAHDGPQLPVVFGVAGLLAAAAIVAGVIVVGGAL